MKNRKLKRIKVENFSVFRDVEIEFSPGINVFIGENSTGKTHLLKLLYCMLKPFEKAGDDRSESSESIKGVHYMGMLEARFTDKLLGVFKPDERNPGRLVHTQNKNVVAKVRLDYNHRRFIEFSVTSGGYHVPIKKSPGPTPPCVFLPPREALALSEGFIAAYEKRESSFDETYYDLCKSLTATPLKRNARSSVADLMEELESLMGGKIVKGDDRFYLQQSGQEGLIEASLLADGYRKLGTLYRLIATGGVDETSVLLIDEPEASLNPKLIAKMAGILRLLAKKGVQIIVTTHDFLLAYHLSLAVEYAEEPEVPIKFFSLSRESRSSPVTVESGSRMADLTHNSILDEFAAHYDREQELFARSVNGGEHG